MRWVSLFANCDAPQFLALSKRASLGGSYFHVDTYGRLNIQGAIADHSFISATIRALLRKAKL